MSGEGNGSSKTRETVLNALICARVRDRRLDLGVLQSQVAEHLGLAHSTYSRYESGQRVLSAAMLALLAAYLRQPVSTFLPGGAEAPATDNRELRRVIEVLEQRPDLLPHVTGLLDTMLDEAYSQ